MDLWDHNGSAGIAQLPLDNPIQWKHDTVRSYNESMVTIKVHLSNLYNPLYKLEAEGETSHKSLLEPESIIWKIYLVKRPPKRTMNMVYKRV